MKNYEVLFSLLVIVLFLNSCKTEKPNTKENGFSTEERLYLGQELLNLTPVPFAPCLVTTGGWEYSGVFSPDMTEFYFLRKVIGVNEQEFVVYKNEGNKWNEKVMSSRQGQPFISTDGKTMHLGRRYKERLKNGNWSEIKKLDTPFDSLPIMRLTASSKATQSNLQVHTV